jgi:hypothetical protein
MTGASMAPSGNFGLLANNLPHSLAAMQLQTTSSHYRQNIMEMLYSHDVNFDADEAKCRR